MNSTKQIVWETKRDMYNRLWEKMNDAIELTSDPAVGAHALVRELKKIRDELETENKA